MKSYIYFFCFFGALPHGYAQLNLVSFEQIDSLQKVEARNIIVFIHTNWCQYCQVMKNKTFKNNEIINTINDKFYFIEFNAEEKRIITYNNQTFQFKPNGYNLGVHELAIELGTINGQLSYPTLCILNHKGEIIFHYNSFLNVKDLKLLFDKINY